MKHWWRRDSGSFKNILWLPGSTLIYPLICTLSGRYKTPLCSLGLCSILAKESVQLSSCGEHTQAQLRKKAYFLTEQQLSLNSLFSTLNVKNTRNIRHVHEKRKWSSNENFENKKLSKIETRGLRGISMVFFFITTACHDLWEMLIFASWAVQSELLFTMNATWL